METAASIIAVVQLSEKVIKYIRDVSGATDERRRLREQVRACSNVLLTLKDGIEDSDEGHAWAETVELLAPPLTRLYKALELAAAKLQSASGTREKLKWPFKEKDVQRLIEAIESEKSLLILSLESSSNKLLQHISSQSKEGTARIVELTTLLEAHVANNGSDVNDIKDAVHTIRDNQQIVKNEIADVHETHKLKELAELRLTILEWLSPIDHALRQHDKISRRQAGTCNWFLESETFQAWLNAISQTLFCPGIPGAGKTVLSAVVVASLWERYSGDSTTTIVFFFCEFARQQEQSLDNILLSILKQLVASRSSLSSTTQAFYDHFGQGRRRPVHDEILKVLQAECFSYAKVFILVDALDECDCNQELLSDLLQIQAECNVNIMATSRLIPEIIHLFKDTKTVEVQATFEDVQSYIEGQIRHKPKLNKLDLPLQEEIKTGIANSVDGMFLLAKLHLDSLIGKRSVKAIRDTLRGLATGVGAYDYAYQSAMGRIESQVSDQVDLARQVLAWIVHAERQLTTIELREALGIEAGQHELDRDNCPDVDDMVSACAGLVIVDKGSNVIRLVHYTTQEYFIRTKQIWFPDAQNMITASCTTYLSMDHGKSERDWNGGHVPFEPSHSGLVLWNYAAKYWGKHAALAPAAHSWVMDFLRRPEKVNMSSYALLDERHSVQMTRMSHSLHMAAYFGLSRATSELLQEFADPDPRTPTQDTTPLIIAALRAEETIVKLLLEANAAVDHVDRFERTPLSAAVGTGSEKIVQLLLDHHAVAAGQPCQKLKPLHCAVINGCDHVARQLIHHGASATQQDSRGRIALHFAAHDNSLDEALSVLPNRESTDARDSLSNTPLHSAASAGSFDIVRLLLDNHADINAKGYKGRTPLHLAANKNEEAIGRILLVYGADITLQDFEGRTAFELAAKKGFTSVVRALLDFGVDVNRSPTQSNTPISATPPTNTNSEATSATTDDDADADADTPNIPDKHYSALHYACWYQHTEVVRLLLDAGANPNLSKTDSAGVTPLHLACWRNDEATVGMLLAAGASVNTKDMFGDTPLDICRRHKRNAFTAQLLRNHGAVEAVATALPRETQDGGSFEEGKDKDTERATEGKKGDGVRQDNEVGEATKGKSGNQVRLNDLAEETTKGEYSDKTKQNDHARKTAERQSSDETGQDNHAGKATKVEYSNETKRHQHAGKPPDGRNSDERKGDSHAGEAKTGKDGDAARSDEHAEEATKAQHGDKARPDEYAEEAIHDNSVEAGKGNHQGKIHTTQVDDPSTLVEDEWR